MLRKIPYAVANYEKLVGEGFYFVDKTRFIRELEDYQAPVMLRPRRFGKSLWCSILECYYDINRKDKFDNLFGNTDIGRSPTPSRSSRMVMRFDFSKVKVDLDYASIERSFNDECRNFLMLFMSFYADRLGLDERMIPADVSGGLSRILAIARSKALPPVYVIIDEYDNFTNQLVTSRQESLYNEVTTGDSFLRTFFKVIKSGVGDGSVAGVFITGVLPITIDDLTSGFNIAEIITLNESTLEMMGFTQAEVDSYVNAVFEERGWPDGLKSKVSAELKTHYNGYRLLPDAPETLYNSTILNFYLKHLVLSGGKLPRETIDDNVRVDVNWLSRLAGGDEQARSVLEKLMFEGSLPIDLHSLRSKFNMSQFFELQFLPLSLYYLGMLTFRDDYSLEFPNLTVKTIFTEYFNKLERIIVTEGYTDYFRAYIKNHDLSGLFAGYWERYVGQIPAQAFDKVNENFYRTTFFELCSRYLSQKFVFSIEVNRPSGRSDFEAMGRPETEFKDTFLLVEFKHFTKTEGERLEVLSWNAPQPDDVAQVEAYAIDIRAMFPEMSVERHVLYTVGNAGFRLFKLE